MSDSGATDRRGEPTDDDLRALYEYLGVNGWSGFIPVLDAVHAMERAAVEEYQEQIAAKIEALPLRHSDNAFVLLTIGEFRDAVLRVVRGDE